MKAKVRGLMAGSAHVKCIRYAFIQARVASRVCLSTHRCLVKADFYVAVKLH